ncbi:FAD/NAD(P)-binding domain-containing protein [Parathielavia appendiculata]|uniref:FAD/NAD(P)-binding domain-containing protein n=1 Tax=Parathielavia appendiculata TaxID=2587402 RepID=A0AAN6YZ46_9PEZI|nr:FAD/NAD(P)-binding domain-containing protein [Parathielavia appendiculata]
MPSAIARQLRVAVIGTGPAGLSSAIALSELSDIDLRVYEKAGELKNLGAGISVNHNGWKVLELLGIRDRVNGASTNPTVQRNAYTGEIVDPGVPHDPNNAYEARRVKRLVLQEALAAKVPEDVIEFNKKLVGLEDLGKDGVRVSFEDGTETIVDLVVGADGIRSVVRRHMVPDYALDYAYQVGWRCLIPAERLKHIPDLPLTTTSWWYGRAKSVWLSPLDADVSNLTDIEFTARVFNEPPIPGKTVSWGIPVTNEDVFSRFRDCDPRLVEVFKQVPEGNWTEFAAYAGPVPDSLVAWDKLVLIGDSSHPSAGGFGSGSAFAMEDSWTLARSIEYARLITAPDAIQSTVAEALRIFNAIRRPYYQAMADFRKSQKEVLKEVGRKEYVDFDSDLRKRFARDGLGAKRGKGFLAFVYDHDIGKTWKEFVECDQARRKGINGYAQADA